ncbi:hypothetical protein TNCV_4831861 [Trichonephila clavipes]|nr:hypothetical protein TNCV_4831861 [Trichonephila clavipes]
MCSEEKLLSRLKHHSNIEISELVACNKDVSEFIENERRLLSQQIREIYEASLYFFCLLENLKYDTSETSTTLVTAAKTMVLSTTRNFQEQERMIIFALNRDEIKLTRDIDKVLMKHGLI